LVTDLLSSFDSTKVKNGREMKKAGMQDLDSAVLRAATQLSVLSGRMVRLLEHLNRQLSIEREPIVTDSDPSSMIQAELLSARELLKQMVAGHFALVRSLMRKQRRQWIMTVAESTDVGVPVNGGQSSRSRDVETTQQGASPRQSDGHSFTERQRQIIQLVSLGYDNRQIGQSLCIAEQTVKNHLHAIFEKAGVTRRSDLAMEAYDKDEADSTSLLASDFPVNSSQVKGLARRAAGD
jgi:DNA-binding CsgD family transcriptional regulator